MWGLTRLRPWPGTRRILVLLGYGFATTTFKEMIGLVSASVLLSLLFVFFLSYTHITPAVSWRYYGPRIHRTALEGSRSENMSFSPPAPGKQFAPAEESCLQNRTRTWQTWRNSTDRWRVLVTDVSPSHRWRARNSGGTGRGQLELGGGEGFPVRVELRKGSANGAVVFRASRDGFAVVGHVACMLLGAVLALVL